MVFSWTGVTASVQLCVVCLVWLLRAGFTVAERLVAVRLSRPQALKNQRK